ncbi:hypothetical protein D4S03_08310, partial [bacterium]
TPPAAMGFDIILANPPYVRADAQFKHIEDEQERRQKIVEWQIYRKQLKDSKIYETLHEKWDLYIPFLERAYQLLCPHGQMIFIIPDAYNAAKYAEKSHNFFLQNSRVMRIDFCSEIDLFDAGVNNTILHFEKGAPHANHQPIRARRWGKHRDEFDDNVELLPNDLQSTMGKDIFRFYTGADGNNNENIISLGNICYISAGLVIHADEEMYQGEFTTEDVLSSKKDKLHPKRFALGKDIAKWYLRNLRFLEWGTERAPSKFRRPTFPELQDSVEKLVAVRTPGSEPKIIYDDNSLYFDASSVGFVPWHLLKDVVNKSIRKTAKYRYQDPLGDRENREETSRTFDLKYILAIMNSSFTREWLKHKRSSKMHIYPDEWKQLPIAPLPLEAQQPFVEKVDTILGEYARHGYPLPPEAAQRVKDLERELDEMVARLYA